MTARALALPEPVARLRLRAAAWWATLSPRDRRLAAFAALVAGAGLAWLIAVEPALTTLRQAPVTLAQLDAELQQMQLQAAESGSLRAAPPVTPAQAQEALKAATARLGDKARLALQGERATITLSGVDGDALRSLLAEVRSAAHARPIEANWVRGPKGLDGTLVLGLGGAS